MSVIEVTADLLRSWPLPEIRDDTDKETRGRVMVLGGGGEVAGAVLLTAIAAMRAGAGKLQIGAPGSIARHLAVATPEARVMALPETPDGELAAAAAGSLLETVRRCDALAIGPGMLDDGEAGELALRLLEGDGPPAVIDAAAMPAVAERPGRARPGAGRMILTPHAGEMAGLTGREKSEILADPIAAARDLAARLQAVVVLKGAVTFIVTPDGNAWRHEAGCAGLATSGSGDVLCGIIAGFAARGAAPAQAAVWGCYVHGASGRRLADRIAPVGFLARELLDEIAPAIRDVER